jgi:hypothetical protein
MVYLLFKELTGKIIKIRVLNVPFNKSLTLFVAADLGQQVVNVLQ